VILWDGKKEGSALTAPTLLIGAAAHQCNVYTSYDRLYALLGPQHKAKLVVSRGSHCDFMVTGDARVRRECYRLCRGEYSADRVALVGHHTVAWLNYYLRGDLGSYASLYGSTALDDAEAGLVTRAIETAPRAVGARAEQGAILLSWEPYDHPVVDGYNIYRRAEGRQYPGRATAQVLTVSSYVDTDVMPGTTYYYTVRSRDAAGNEHEPSHEVSAVVVSE
jgi:fibronectin type 3 domain-containing protein